MAKYWAILQYRPAKFGTEWAQKNQHRMETKNQHRME